MFYLDARKQTSFGEPAFRGDPWYRSAIQGWQTWVVSANRKGAYGDVFTVDINPKNSGSAWVTIPR
mgnify:CR=1 FL=1